MACEGEIGEILDLGGVGAVICGSCGACAIGFPIKGRSMLRKRTSINVKCCYVAIVSLRQLKSLDRG
ncbi:hypothetical protein QUA54_28590 [Microcoleus sp. MOSTC5]|uniref:hypothetical protein n=1 Tax=Microcoleus sp. MOSTC5 TaxID=3055378 RepID=UPI002FCF1058